MPKKTAAAANLPITLDEAKAHLRVTFADDDTLIEQLIRAATAELEMRCQRTMCETSYTEVLDGFPDGSIMLRLPPLLAVQSVVYYNAAGSPVTMSASDYVVNTHSQPGFVNPAPSKTWPETQDRYNAVTVTYTAGYLAGGNAQQQRDAVPKDLRAWLLIRVATLYENREAAVTGTIVSSVPGLDSLWQPHRVIEA